MLGAYESYKGLWQYLHTEKKVASEIWKENHKIKEKIEFYFPPSFTELYCIFCIYYVYSIFIVYTKNVFFVYIV